MNALMYRNNLIKNKALKIVYKKTRFFSTSQDKIPNHLVLKVITEQITFNNELFHFEIL